MNVMTVNGLTCGFNMPKAIKNPPKYEIKLTSLDETVSYVKDGNIMNKQFNSFEEAEKYTNELKDDYKNVQIIEVEQAIGLPPYAPVDVFEVDEYECPSNWMHGSGLAKSYFVSVKADHGLWLDFNANQWHKHHVAILISIQGINPLDGQSMVDGHLSLKQYKLKCPIHDIDFGAERYCSKCGYKWVPQNYLCTTGTPSGFLWLDGFLAADGVVRQYYFTKEQEKGIAHQILGEEKKVYSIGVAFYLSKELKPETHVVYGRSVNYFEKKYLYQCNHIIEKSYNCYSENIYKPHRPNCLLRSSNSHVEACDDISDTWLDIAAGAKINQKVYQDTENIDFWQDTPAGLIYINYCSEEQVKSIVKNGKKDLTKNGEGYLAGLKR